MASNSMSLVEMLVAVIAPPLRWAERATAHRQGRVIIVYRNQASFASLVPVIPASLADSNSGAGATDSLRLGSPPDGGPEGRKPRWRVRER